MQHLRIWPNQRKRSERELDLWYRRAERESKMTA